MELFRPTAEPFLAMSMVVLALNIFTMPQMMHHKVCSNKYNHSVCAQHELPAKIQNSVQQETSKWMSIEPLISMSPAFILLIILGPFSDEFGKRNTMIMFPLLYLTQSILFLVLVSIKQKFSPGTFMIASCLSGMFGGNAGLELLSVAFLADITTNSERTFRVSILESSMFIGALSAVLISGPILQSFGFQGIFITTATINCLNFLYVLFMIPNEKIESKGKNPGKKLLNSASNDEDSNVGQLFKSENYYESDGDGFFKKTFRICNPCTCYLRVHNVVCQKEIRKTVAMLLSIMALAQFASMGELSVGVLFEKHRPFNMSPKEIGYLAATQFSIRTVGMLLFTFIFQKFIRKADMSLVILGFISQITYFCVFGNSKSKMMLFLAQLCGMAATLHVPVLRSMVSKLVSEEDHGAALAAVEIVDTASSILACLFANVLYSLTVSIYPGMAFFMLALFAFIGLCAAVAVVVVISGKTKSASHQDKPKQDKLSE
eukprot:Seg2085.7 transcript_id=Seg2085.7/GoldUCD/mRNA.D3Y31 product="Proton-coupled folate transporter" protein_id=Seg2085.7/GoldUCD/D3Y31